jgi:UDP-glucose 4-epimerase
MKRILITGANSYIGTSVDTWLSNQKDKYQVDTVDTINDAWKETDFSKYDTVFHVAGIAHVSSDPKLEDLYYKVNRDLTIETANHAKKSGVKQFIFMSSIIVYGNSGKIGEKRVITKDTVPEPADFYGDSKLQAEQGLVKLRDNTFKTVILRPPMIYGPNSKGNFPKLVKLAKVLPCFPDIKNERSMLYIDNLCEFVRLVIDNEESGLYFPQNSEYVNTSKLVKAVATNFNRKLFLTRMFNPIIFLLGNQTNIINKMFGNLVCDKSLSEYEVSYNVVTFEESLTNIALKRI